MDGYSTHIPALAAVMQIAPLGPVIELGAGFYSTPLLHALSAARNHDMVTLESNEDYIDRLANFRTNRHLICHVKSWDFAPFFDVGNYAVAFIDHELNRRKADGERLRHVPVLVFHDTNNAAYGLEPLLASFKYRFDYKKLSPWTTVVSDTIDVATLLKEI